ncbi:MAG: glycosyl hydrolase family 32 [Actinomycetales bacterium]|nr:glycosyl hydrolase family 32 [Actinomycetales bacterium]
MLRLTDRWIWDSWYAVHEGRHHVFYLQADRSLVDPERRHRHPSIGHAVSDDLRHWEVLPDALAPSTEDAFDDWTTWTGSVVRDDAGTWWMFYTGSRHADDGLVQRIGAARSTDLLTWDKVSSDALVSSDARWYEQYGTAAWGDEAWRDPFVFRHADPGDGSTDSSTNSSTDGSADGRWHMLITARATHGPDAGRGVVGHAVSDDLLSWDVLPPITQPHTGFGQLEVNQVEIVDGIPTLLFCCDTPQLDADGLARHGRGGVFSVTGPSLLGPFDIAAARRFDHDDLYAARLVAHAGRWHLIGFRNIGADGFIGELSDPIPVTVDPAHGGLVRVD